MPQGGISFAKPADMSTIGNQNLMKLRVNRVAILQELEAEHVVGHLAKMNVLTVGEMRTVCMEKENPVAVLLDILATKDKRTQWYAHFIHALRQAPVEHEHRRRYCRLVDFLENTIIRFPGKSASTDKGAKQFPRYKPLPDIGSRTGCSSQLVSTTTIPGGDTKTNTHEQKFTVDSTMPSPRCNTSAKSHPKQAFRTPEPDITNDKVAIVQTIDTQPSMTLISGHYHQWVPSPTPYQSRLSDPTELYIELETTDDKEFHDQIKTEKLVLQRMRELETLYIMHRQKRLPQGFILCMGDCVTQIVDDVDNHHFYVKYFMQLKHDYNLYIVKDLVGSFTNWLMATKLGDVQKNADLLQRATQFALNLFDLLHELGDYVCADAIVSVLTLWLMAQPCLETWTPGYTACIRLARIRIQNFRFSDADKSLNSAVQYLNAIKLMSFGQKLVDESEKMVATSWLMHELGSHEAAYHWAHDGLKEVDPQNKRSVINALCNGVTCFSSTYAMKRAHQLAVEAVQQAGMYFGHIHPMFIKARLTYIVFVNKFCQPSEEILKIALDTLKRCKLIYNCDSMLLARAHMTVSDAYIAAGKLTDDNYVSHASKAQRIAMNCVDGMHPVLAMFSEQIAKCAFIKSRQVPKPQPTAEALAAMKTTLLTYAASELSVAYRIYSARYGTHSYRAAVTQVLLADIFMDEGKFDDARVVLEDTLSTYDICLRAASPHLGQFKARLAQFYYDQGELKRTLNLLDDVVQSLIKRGEFDAGHVRLQWMEDMFDLHVKAVSDLNDLERLQQVTTLRDTWRQTTEPLKPLRLADLATSPLPFTQFQKSFMLWRRVEPKKMSEVSDEIVEIAENENNKIPSTDS